MKKGPFRVAGLFRFFVCLAAIYLEREVAFQVGRCREVYPKHRQRFEQSGLG